jgi:hypothetical protein
MQNQQMIFTACEFAAIDLAGYLNFVDRHFGMGTTVSELPGGYLRHF